jgi:hypothetical protein
VNLNINEGVVAAALLLGLAPDPARHALVDS